MPRGEAQGRDEVMRCLDDETLALLLDGALDASEDRLVRTHLDGCDDCRRLFADVARSATSQSQARAGAPEAGDEGGAARAAGAAGGTGSTQVVVAGQRAGPKLGDVIADKYRIERALGEGGMGVVLAARHLELAKTVALKVLRPELSDDADAKRRFAREAKAAASLKSAHSTRIFDVDRLDDGRPFLVMEYLDGCDLATKLERDGPLPVEDAVDYLLQACDALAEAHRLGIIHRDLKPHNLFLTRVSGGRDVVKVLDFGLAKSIDTAAKRLDEDASMTGTNVMLGSPFFMSPEQAGSGRKIDVRSDVWSLGATLYHLVSGTPPFVAPTLYLLCARILREDFRPIQTRVPDAPPELEHVLRRCMNRDPDARYASIDELAKALTRVLGPPVPSDDPSLGGPTEVDKGSTSVGGTALMAAPPATLPATPAARMVTTQAPEPPPVVPPAEAPAAVPAAPPPAAPSVPAPAASQMPRPSTRPLVPVGAIIEPPAEASPILDVDTKRRAAGIAILLGAIVMSGAAGLALRAYRSAAAEAAGMAATATSTATTTATAPTTATATETSTSTATATATAPTTATATAPTTATATATTTTTATATTTAIAAQDTATTASTEVPSETAKPHGAPSARPKRPGVGTRPTSSAQNAYDHP
jgi:serine/threonine-protein kinase